MTDELTEKVARAMSMHELRRDDAWPGYSELAFVAIAAVREAETDEIDRLRAEVEEWKRQALYHNAEHGKCIDEIRRLQAENERLRTALQTIVDSYDARSELYANDADCAGNLADRARAALQETNR